ncbi:MAG: ABC transporter permease [Anaerolineales bacterium]|nr:ABC transporter permease [Anaerolineales bacterium]
MKAISIAIKNLRELWREPLLLGLLFIFPILLLAFYFIAFSKTNQSLASFLKILILNHDQGFPSTASTVSPAEHLIRLLDEAEYEGSPIFEVSLIENRENAEIDLREHKATLLLIIPEDFSSSIIAAQHGADIQPIELTLVGDPYTDNYAFTRSILDDYIAAFIHQTAGWQENLTLSYEFIPGTGTMSDLDFGIPGLIVFSLMLITMITATTLTREHVNKTLQRIRLTNASSTDLLLGVTMAQMVIAAFTVPFTFGAAWLMGFRAYGSVLLAIVIGLLLSLSVAGLGLICACFSHSDSEAANLSATVGVLLALVSGAMYPMPQAPLFTWGGRVIQVYDFLPPAHAAEAMRRALVLGDTAGDIIYELIMLSILGLIFLAIGIVFYQHFQLRKK